MKRDFLKELELSDEQIDAVMKEHGKAINEYKEKSDKVESLESQISDYEQQIKDRDQQLEGLQDKAKNNKGLSEEIDRLKQENQQAADEWKQKLESQQKDFAIENALRDAKAKNPKIAKNALDLDGIEIKDGKLLGLDEQIKEIQESDGYLFEQEQPNNDPKPSFTTGQHQKQNKSVDLSKMSYKERVKFKKENPDKYNELVGK